MLIQTSTRFVMVVLASGLLASGCASRSEPGTAGSATAANASGPSASAPDQRSGKSGIRDHVVYFDFDRDEVRPGEQALLDTWARYLAANPKAQVRLEGHADERGSSEYNVSLGERRANAIRDALTARGAAANQFTVVSYGEDRPAVSGQSQRAWSRNRRVEIID